MAIYDHLRNQLALEIIAATREPKERPELVAICRARFGRGVVDGPATWAKNNPHTCYIDWLIDRMVKHGVLRNADGLLIYKQPKFEGVPVRRRAVKTDPKQTGLFD